MGKPCVKSCFFEKGLGVRAGFKNHQKVPKFDGYMKSGKMTPLKTVQKKKPLVGGSFWSKSDQKSAFFLEECPLKLSKNVIFSK